MMDTRFELIDRCTTFNELLHDMELILNKEHLFYGHGTEMPWMNQWQSLCIYQSNDILDKSNSKHQLVIGSRKSKEVLYQRVTESKPLPYITNEYFCERSFMSMNVFLSQDPTVNS